MNDALCALAHHDRSLSASAATEQAVMACWDAECFARAERPGRLRSRSGRMASWIPAVAAAALLAVAAAAMTWSAEPQPGQPVVVAESTSRRVPVVTGRSEADVFIQLGPVTPRELNGTSLQLMRVQLRRGMLDRLGLAVSDIRASEIVEADVLFGEDGVARAIRFER